MSLKSTAGIVGAFACAMTIALLRPSVVRGDEPVVMSTTDPCPAADIGTKKVTTETHATYRITTHQGTCKSRSDAAIWNSIHRVVYNELAGEKVVGVPKLADSSEWHTAKDSHSMDQLMWTDVDGSNTTEACGKFVYEKVTIVTHQLIRQTALGFFSSGYRIKTYSGAEPAPTEYTEFVPKTLNGKSYSEKDVKSLEDTTDCNNEKFPFQLLKEKPPNF
jgi:hypothetical protein